MIPLSRLIKQAMDAQGSPSALTIPENARIFTHRDKDILYSKRISEKGKVKKHTRLLLQHLFILANPGPGMEHAAEQSRRYIVKKMLEPVFIVLRETNTGIEEGLPILSGFEANAVLNDLRHGHGYKWIKVHECYMTQLYLYLHIETNYLPYPKNEFSEKILYDAVDGAIARIKSDPMQKDVIVR